MQVETRNIFVVGDIHGHPRPVTDRIEQMNLSDSIFIILGDIGLGFYNDHTGPIKFLNKEGVKRNNMFYLIRGNHDNPDSFSDERIAEVEKKYTNVRLLRDFEEIELTFNNKKGLVVPGAISIDRCIRIEGSSYWSNETIRYDMIDSLKDKKYDFVLAHSGPEPLYIKVDDTVERIAQRSDHFLLDDIAKERKAIDEIIDFVKPEFWINGHYHHYASFEHKGTKVHVLAECGGDETEFLFALPMSLTN